MLVAPIRRSTAVYRCSTVIRTYVLVLDRYKFVYIPKIIFSTQTRKRRDTKTLTHRLNRCHPPLPGPRYCRCCSSPSTVLRTMGDEYSSEQRASVFFFPISSCPAMIRPIRLTDEQAHDTSAGSPGLFSRSWLRAVGFRAGGGGRSRASSGMLLCRYGEIVCFDLHS